MTTLTPFAPVDPATPVLFDIVDSPVGRILLTGDGTSLHGLNLLDARHPPRVERAWTRNPGAFIKIADQLAAYFAGDLKEFEVPLALAGSDFELDVWAALTRIPYGATTSYGQIAIEVGKSLVASRAVGKANGRNPVSIIVPCHRVIGADGTLTGYGWGLDRKEWLLRHEGALPPPAPALW